MKKIIIGFPVAYFCSWAGGSNLALSFTNAVNLACTTVCKNIQPLLMLDVNKLEISLPINGYLCIKKNDIKATGVLKEFLMLSTFEEIYLYKDLKLASKSLNLDIIGPSYHYLNEDFEIPWAGYLFDFQHRHFPGFFNQADIDNRNILFKKILTFAPIVFVNSQTVINDIKKFYSINEVKSCVRRFPLTLSKNNFDISVNSVLDRFAIKNDYFIVCCQQWKHKSHDIIIRSFASFLCQNKAKCELIITGEQKDYRYPELKSQIDNLIEDLNLNHSVRYLGLIDRSQQLALISGSKALIQASVIEGGPGASGVAEAASLDVPILASNIEANLEMALGRNSFFEIGNEESLAILMNEKFSNKNDKRSPLTNDEIDAINLSCGVQIIKMLTNLL